MSEPPRLPLVERRREGAVEVLVITTAEVFKVDAVDEIGRELKHAVEASDATQFVLDLAAVKFLSSTALGIFISLQRRVVQKKAELKLAGVREGIQELFALTRLDTVFPIYRDTASAVEAFGHHG
jgi:anti-sigma B factor antagonist